MKILDRNTVTIYTAHIIASDETIEPVHPTNLSP